ncbi:MAG: hypothetical protein ACRDRL_34190 [Sciscionella sp.]
MATIDGRQIDLTVPGGALFLTAPAQRDWVEQLPDGVTVCTAQGSTAAMVSGLDERLSLEDAADVVRRTVNEALDLLAVRSLGVYTLNNLTSPTITWALPRSQVWVRTTSDAHSTFSAAVGGPPNPFTRSWHPSMRYFRLSQTTNDLFDAFRNLYLAPTCAVSFVDIDGPNAVCVVGW